MCFSKMVFNLGFYFSKILLVGNWVPSNRVVRECLGKIPHRVLLNHIAVFDSGKLRDVTIFRRVPIIARNGY